MTIIVNDHNSKAVSVYVFLISLTVLYVHVDGVFQNNVKFPIKAL